VKAIIIDSVGKPVSVTGSLTIRRGVTVTLSRGSDLYVEGTLTNNGTINVPGADKIVSADFINYSVLNVRKGGKLINNGAVNLMSASLPDTEDHGPIGGQLRVFDGECVNNGSVFLKRGAVNTHGGMLVVAEGPLSITPWWLWTASRSSSGTPLPTARARWFINNTYVCTRGGGVFSDHGILSGNKIVEE
jgi:hypothetical protein